MSSQEDERKRETVCSGLERESLHRVFDGLHGPCPHGLARRLGRESLLLFRERVDSIARGLGRLLHDDKLREAVEHEHAVLLQLLVTDLDERLDDLLHVLARELLPDLLADGVEDLALGEGLLRRRCGLYMVVGLL